MPNPPEPNADAFRTLGLEPGASMAEVKRAYRLLAKAFHPDSAGEAALPRFLAIHEAYDRLKTGRVAPASRPARAAPAEPWRADPARARAAREKARTGKTGSAAAGAGTPGSAPGSRQGAGPATGGARGSSGARGSGRRHVRKATMGSTSYDEARDHNDATWSGASWYGPSSGEYWIVNPREYADPRKHGPEYLQRARRPLPGDGGGAGSDDPVETTATATAMPGAEAPPSAWRPSASGALGEEPSRRWAAGATASSWAAPADLPGGAAARAGEHAIPRAAPLAPSPDPAANLAPGTTPGATGWAFFGCPADDPIRRLGLALVAWPPLGLAAAAAIGNATGCAASSASCVGTESLLPWLAQAGILGLLLLLPPLTRVLAGGAVAVVLALLPMTLLLTVLRGSETQVGSAAFALCLGTAWLIGIGWSVRTRYRRRAVRAGP